MFNKKDEKQKMEQEKFKPTILWQGIVDFPKGFSYHLRIVQTDKNITIMETKDIVTDSLGNERWYRITSLYRD